MKVYQSQPTLIFVGLVSLFIIGCVSAQTTTAVTPPTAAQIKAEYDRWVAQYKPCYGSDSSIQTYRQSVFAENYNKILLHNSNKTNTYTLGMNAFSDQTQEEFEARYLSPIFQAETHRADDEDDNDLAFKAEDDLLEEQCTSIQTGTTSSASAISFIKKVPSSVDWRTKGAVTPVKNQGSCGSCWAFSTTGMLEGVNVLRGNPLTSFSEQQLVDCCGKKGFLCQGCNGAWPKDAVNYVKKWGILKQAQYAYVGVEGACKVTKASGFFVKHKKYVFPNQISLKRAIAKQPVSVAVHASNWYMYSSGIFNNCSSSKYSANHAVTAIGYNTSNQWILKNSWGTSWGAAGYITLAAGNTCGIYNYALIAKI